METKQKPIEGAATICPIEGCCWNKHNNCDVTGVCHNDHQDSVQLTKVKATTTLVIVLETDDVDGVLHFVSENLDNDPDVQRWGWFKPLTNTDDLKGQTW